MSLKVVNLGLPKTGTTTLARALRRGGLVVADFRMRGRQVSDPALKGAFVGELVYRGYFETGDPAAHLNGIHAITEMSVLNRQTSLWPQTDLALIRAMRDHHPGLRFLASKRDTFEVSQSMLAWSNLGTSRLPLGAVPGLPSGYGETSKEREIWIDGHYQTLADFFRGRDDYLEYDTADPNARAKIAEFLGVELPWWGRANANPIREAAS